MSTTLVRTPFGDIDRLVRDLWTPRGAATSAPRGPASPAADLYRDGEDVVVRLDLPGIDPARDVTVEVEGRRLVVRGERRDLLAEKAAGAEGDAPEGTPHEDAAQEDEQTEDRSAKGSGRQARVREVRYGAFRRVVTLPRPVDGDAVRATYDAGVLTLTVAGAYAGTTPQRIEVTTAA
ncbi:Hsp20/alpha crystallin family protein [Cellulomonas sp. PhB143]|uniref:Hsp20/alpha crystallin family protein n=1 Tax=Cellulomonas sp. PhB143 TaxID=2485186 RepID=UPI000F4688FD|nr:Hsp20/alpha crystallin family protein [Cellulomonas sp. PhB143]ROS79162.1 HSP20 family molecular chaperone IbpA [Cellulomonas sp. PhB143]